MIGTGECPLRRTGDRHLRPATAHSRCGSIFLTPVQVRRPPFLAPETEPLLPPVRLPAWEQSKATAIPFLAAREILSMFFTKDRSDAANDLSALRRDLARLADTVSTLASQQAREAQSTVRHAGHDAGATLTDLLAQARHLLGSLRDTDLGKVGSMVASEAGDRLSSVNTKVESQIGRNPMTSVAVAAGVGLLLGLMSRSR